MHKVRTPWPVATRVQYIVAFQECRRRWLGLSARRFCSVAEVPYPTFARWWAVWRKQGKHAPLDRSRRPRRSPRALPRSGPGRHPSRPSPTGLGSASPPRLFAAGLPHPLQP